MEEVLISLDKYSFEADFTISLIDEKDFRVFNTLIKEHNSLPSELTSL
jgi:hypothetical protein